MDNMKVFTCRDRYDDMATCIYEAWSMALQVGHGHVMLMKEPVEQLDMFADYIHVEPDADKVQKFTRSVKKVSWLVYRNGNAQKQSRGMHYCLIRRMHWTLCTDI